ncbi:hypothetical protein M8C21_008603 [Ambrosia artemisiifolia]|uniref:DNA repair protein recA homolog 2, mitochondrial n=1 Tax=Ambrosia artemisiifolia TaxID=4212 RepID=A0AAD5BQB0_AMBAR|nr:hypothetical protein M8C21_008603 [Ambrosia artemisiifolia]
MSSKLPFTNLFRSILLSSSKQQKGLCFSHLWANTTPYCFSSAAEVSDVEDDKLHDDMKVAEKHTALHSALSELAGAFDGESMVFLQRFFRARVKPVISTGSLKLDLALGIGGLPKGRIVEIYGQEASGKTTLALNVIREAQKLGGYCAYLDVENALDPKLLEMIGVNTKSLLISQPSSAENVLSIVDTLTKSGAVDVIVVDSVRSNLKSRQEGLKNVSEVTCGGNALPFYSAVRLRIARKGLLKTQEKVTGLGICVEVMKNKLAPAMKKAELEIEFGKGISRAAEILELACEHGVALKEGNCYFIEGEVLNSKIQAEAYLIKNEQICDTLVKSLRRQLFHVDEDSDS